MQTKHELFQASEKDRDAIKALLDNEEAIKGIVENIMKDFDTVSMIYKLSN